ncbi:zinc-binding dehydrogenase [Mucilaginibacter sp. JRF]|uniref:quinone oxidoreductase family protein n=1 Tax=Mucilaginibacter sp. JRF TaxID=2780088 RepID=UPI00187E365B|nr:zinc-binding dehydrogenase [Mucilaginibacter sp. JRF]MBE9586564.1 zinc-binding dehydrogenase [Mucilaginibacter sp. JRF]
MKAIVLEGLNQPLAIKDIEKPTPQPGEVLVQLKAASLNRRDWWITQGKYAGISYPCVIGSDGAGVVVAAGSDAESQWLNKEVVIYPARGWGESPSHQSKDFNIIGLPPNQGTFAEYISVPVADLQVKPTHLNWEQTATLPVAGLTTFRALFTKGQAQKGDKVLITGVGGGTGAFALQYAVAAGCQVFVTSGSAEKIDRARHLGASAGVNYKAQDWAEQLLQLSGGGFDVIIDSALGNGFEKLVDICKPGGRIVFFGGTAGTIPELNGRKIFWNHISILGTTLGTAAEFEQMLQFISEHKIEPVIDEVLPLAYAEKAIRRMDDSSQFGKLVLSIG